MIKFDGYTADELLDLPHNEFDAYVFCDDALVMQIGTSSVLGSFQLIDDTLIIELAQIDGGGEGVLPALGALAKRIAQSRNLRAIKWYVHAINCAEPNPKLRRMLIRRDFEIAHVEGVGEVYQFEATV